jgi:hypothetical protein
MARILRSLASLSTLALLLAVPEVVAQQPTGAIVGRVLGQGEAAVVDAAVTLNAIAAEGPPRTVLTDRTGAFRFVGLPSGHYRLDVQRIGFAPLRHPVELGVGESQRVELTLVAQAVVLEGVIAEGRREIERERARFETEPGITARVVEAATLKVLPGLGEADVLRAIELLPGVISTSDFSSSYNVRGGSADQNLILIDGFTVFNPFHLGGVFSVFNSDAVERVELFAGGFGAEFGGRVSSVLNIESRSEPADSVEVVAGVSMLATRVLVRAPLPAAVARPLGGGGGSWFVSARRSYFDQILRPVTTFPYHLTDFQAHLSAETTRGGRVTITAYAGEDVLDLSRFGLDESGAAADVLRLRWNWGNRVLGGRWLQPLGHGWIAESRLGFSRFAETLGFIDFGDVRFHSGIEQLTWRGDLAKDLSPSVSVRIGAAYDRTSHDNLAEAGGTTFFASEGVGGLGAAHGSIRWRPGRWIVEPGLRTDSWTSGGSSRTVVAPRFAAKRFLGRGDEIAVKFAVGRYAQFLHSLRDEELPISNDTWVLASAAVPHVVSDQVQVGVESFWGAGWSASIEGYHRTFRGVTEFNPVENPNDPSDDFLKGEGLSYGLDLLLRRMQGRLTGWTALSLLRAQRTFPDPLARDWPHLPQTVTYPPIYDRRVNLDLVGQYTTARGMEVGARWNYGSGLPYTRPIAQHFSWRQSPHGRAEPLGGGADRAGIPIGVVLGPRNSERYPPYHRLDVTVRRPFEPSWGVVVPYLQVLNLYNRRNVLFYFYDYHQSPPVRSGFSMFPLLPALGVEVTF